MNLTNLLILAEFARVDNNIIENHKNHGVHVQLQVEWVELYSLLDYMGCVGQRADDLRTDMKRIEDALRVYGGGS